MKTNRLGSLLTLLLIASSCMTGCGKIATQEERNGELTVKRVQNPDQTITKIFYRGGSEVAQQTRGNNDVILETTGTIPDGIVREYYQSGALMEEAPYLNGKREGMSTWYYETGIVKGKRLYKAGKLDGIIKWYYTTGSLGTEFNYKNGKLEGLTKLYWENGNLKAEDYYENGRREGRKTLYYNSGELRFVYTYKNGRKISRKEYSTTGNLIATEEY
jgi:antitoxin component YwqK of YwqJK toxin-antitoxin module